MDQLTIAFEQNLSPGVIEFLLEETENHSGILLLALKTGYPDLRILKKVVALTNSTIELELALRQALLMDSDVLDDIEDRLLSLDPL